MAVYSAPLFRVHEGVPGSSPYDSSEVPVNYVWVVRQITFGGSSPSTDSAFLYLLDLAPVTYFIARFSDAASGGDYVATQLQVRLVMSPGWFLRLSVAGGIVDLTVSGYQLSNF